MLPRGCYRCLCCINWTVGKWLAGLSVIGLLAFISTRFWSDPGRLVQVHGNYFTLPAVQVFQQAAIASPAKGKFNSPSYLRQL